MGTSRPLSWLSESLRGPVHGFGDPRVALVQPFWKAIFPAVVFSGISCPALSWASSLRRSSGLDPILCSLCLGDQALTSCSQGHPQGGRGPRGGVEALLVAGLFDGTCPLFIPQQASEAHTK